MLRVVLTFRWFPAAVPDSLPVSQVYGWCFADCGRVLLRDDAGKIGMPGGKPEPGETREETLHREAMEECQVLLTKPVYLGYQRVTPGDGSPPFAQMRYAARIDSFLPRAVDPDKGRMYRRLLTPVHRAPGRLDWGVPNLLQAAAAALVAEQELGLDPNAQVVDRYRD